MKKRLETPGLESNLTSVCSHCFLFLFLFFAFPHLNYTDSIGNLSFNIEQRLFQANLKAPFRVYVLIKIKK